MLRKSAAILCVLLLLFACVLPALAAETPFFVSDELWEGAFFLHDKAGNLTSAIGFSSIPEGTELFMPYDGYKNSYFDILDGDPGARGFFVTENENWLPPSDPDPEEKTLVIFLSVGVNSFLSGYVHKGDLMMRIPAGIDMTMRFFSEPAQLVVMSWNCYLNLQRFPQANPFPKDYLELLLK